MKGHEIKEKKDGKAKTLRRIDPLMETLFLPVLEGNAANAANGVEVVRWPFGGGA